MADAEYKRLRPMCAVDDCTKEFIAFGMCQTHYLRVKKTGSTDAPKHVLVACSVDGCKSISTRKGLCGKHYSRIRNTGTTDERKYGRNICTVESCARHVKGQGFCNIHLDKYKKYGDPLLTNALVKVKPTCQQCGAAIPINYPSVRGCSSKCMSRLRSRIPEKFRCLECSALFDFHERAKTCSSECAALRRAKTLKKWNEAKKLDPEHMELRRLTQQRRRARIKGSEAEMFSFKDIADRDRWSCRLCGEKVRRYIKFPDKLSASLDHIIPISKGGSHTRANVQLAHLHCNKKKSVNVKGQLLMFG